MSCNAKVVLLLLFVNRVCRFLSQERFFAQKKNLMASVVNCVSPFILGTFYKNYNKLENADLWH
jgi:hypothetical protein